MSTISQVISFIKSQSSSKDKVFVAIDGRGGSGKTTTSLLIKQEIPDAIVITTDDFLDEDTHKIDIQELQRQILEPLSIGKDAMYLEFNGSTRTQRIVKPEGVIIIEGVFSSHSSIQRYYDLTVWVQAPDVDERVRNRDGKIHENWEKYHRPDENTYIRDDNPKDRATYVIANNFNEKLSNLDNLWKKFI